MLLTAPDERTPEGVRHWADEEGAGRDRALAAPWFHAVRGRAGVDVSGDADVFRGHRIPHGDGTPDGVFAEWKWDGRRLRVRNDRYGVHPLFYYATANEIAVSTSVARLLAGGAPADFDGDAIAVFLRLGFFVGEDTPFRAIRAVPPEAKFEWEDGRLSISGGYWHGKPQGLNRDDAIDAFIALFRRALERRIAPDDNFAVPLSGGRDSRHILLELCRLGRRPRCCITIPRYPPRAPEDERVSGLLAAAAGVPHRILDQPPDRGSVELRKNWETHFCADEHAWFVHMIDYLEAEGLAVYDGLAGGLSVAGRFLSAGNLRLFEHGRFHELAEGILARFGVQTEAHLSQLVSPAWREAAGRDRALERLAAELIRHADAPDPTKSFNFWNHTRRETALVPYALMNRLPAVFTPYIDHDVYELLSSLPPSIVSPDLSSPNKSFHSEAIQRAYVEHADVPFENSHAPKLDARPHYRQFGSHAARFIASRTRRPFTLLNNAYVWPRVAMSLVSPHFAEKRAWLPADLLYMSQLEHAARSAAESIGKASDP